MLFSYVILCDFHPIKQIGEDLKEIGRNVNTPELALSCWVLVFLFDNIYLMATDNKKLIKTKLKLDQQAAAILLFFIGLAFRYIPNMHCYLISRIMLSLDIVIWFSRSLHYLSFVRNLGPKIVMISQMIKELMNFITIILVFIFAYGVSTQALMYHNQAADLNLIRNVFFPAYFVIGGDYYERENIMNAASCERQDSTSLISDVYTQGDCPEEYGAKVSLALLVCYIVMQNILLVNLLIAIFSSTFSAIESSADSIWKFTRFALLEEYSNKPFLPSPFSVFYYFFRLLEAVATRKRYVKENAFKLEIGKQLMKDELQLKRWENFIADEYFIKDENQNKETLDYKIQNNIDKLELIDSRLAGALDSRAYLENRMDLIADKLKQTELILKENQNLNTKLVELENKIDLILNYIETKKSVDKSESNEMSKLTLYPDSINSITEYNRCWNIKWLDYCPVEYTSGNVLNNPLADYDLIKLYLKCFKIKVE